MFVHFCRMSLICLRFSHISADFRTCSLMLVGFSQIFTYFFRCSWIFADFSQPKTWSKRVLLLCRLVVSYVVKICRILCSGRAKRMLIGGTSRHMVDTLWLALEQHIFWLQIIMTLFELLVKVANA